MKSLLIHIPILLIVAILCRRYTTAFCGEPPVVSSPGIVSTSRPVSWLAVPSNNGHYVGYYVGGGAPARRGEPRAPDDGTWGWDYRGWLIPRRVTLSWWHGRRYQAGAGAYRTDGPHYHEASSAKD